MEQLTSDKTGKMLKIAANLPVRLMSGTPTAEKMIRNIILESALSVFEQRKNNSVTLIEV